MSFVEFFIFGLLLTAYMNRSYIHALNESEALARDLELRVKERTKDLHNANEKLTLLASTDGLTGLANRRALDERFEQERKSAKRVGQELCLALVDADFFKKVNDSHGHDVGDKVLVHLANTMINELRESDLVARIGGEEFVVLLPTRNLAGGVTKLNHVRESIAQSTIPFGDEDITISVSIGVTKVVPEDDLRSALKRADNALYIAKEKGRNRLEGIELLT